jgi:hypothetical protein
MVIVVYYKGKDSKKVKCKTESGYQVSIYRPKQTAANSLIKGYLLPLLYTHSIACLRSIR